MELRTTRRLTGPSRWASRPAAVGEVRLSRHQDEAALQRWSGQYKRCITQAAEAIGWPGTEAFAVRDGLDLMVGLYAPLDGLYVACDLVEWAVEALLDAAKAQRAEKETASQATAANPKRENIEAPPNTEVTADTAAAWGAASTEVASTDTAGIPRLSGKSLDDFLRMVQREHNPHLLAMHQAAATHDVPFLQCDDHISLGLGKHTHLWMTNALPAPEALDALPWERYQPIPVAMITGTNGKTTTARMLARIGKHTGYRVGNTSTDGLAIDGKSVESGDWTGPGGARHILRHQDIDMAVLETARGGMLRRGLVCQWANAAVVTNVSNDHLGEWGIDTVAQMAEVKLLIRHGLRGRAPLILNADCPPLIEALRAQPDLEGLQVSWYSLAFDPDSLAERLPCGRLDAWCDSDALYLRSPLQAPETKPEVLPLAAIPSTFGGAAKHNVANAMAAALAALSLEIDVGHVSAGLRSFHPSVADSPGRGNVFYLDGARIIVDFGHNPAGVEAIGEMVEQLNVTGRRLVLLGQAGDRSDEEIQGLANAAITMAPDQILLKEMLPYLRGRRPWEVTGLLRDVCIAQGTPPHQITTTGSEQDAVEWALSWVQPGDLLVLFIHADFTGTIEQLQAKGATENDGSLLGDEAAVDGERSTVDEGGAICE